MVRLVARPTTAGHRFLRHRLPATHMDQVNADLLAVVKKVKNAPKQLKLQSRQIDVLLSICRFRCCLESEKVRSDVGLADSSLACPHVGLRGNYGHQRLIPSTLAGNAATDSMPHIDHRLLNQVIRAY